MERRRIVKSVEINPAKIDYENRLITTQLMQVDEPDSQGDRTSAAEITKALDSYTLTFPRAVGRQHKQLTNNVPWQMWQGEDGGLYVTTKVNDDADWADVKQGKITGKSWAGYAYSKPAGDGTNWLVDIEMDEYSLVDFPAVQTANFKSDDGEDEDGSLVQQLRAGKHNWRRRELGVAKGDKQMTLRDKILTGLVKLGVIEPITSADNEGREEKQGGSLDMTEEQIKELLAEFKAELSAELDEKFKALGNEAEDVDGAGVGAADAEELGNRIDELHDELGKLTEQGDGVAKALAELTEIVKELPLASGKQNYDGGEGTEHEYKPARCSR